jgi:hypothetical protein
LPLDSKQWASKDWRAAMDRLTPGQAGLGIFIRQMLKQWSELVRLNIGEKVRRVGRIVSPHCKPFV